MERTILSLEEIRDLIPKMPDRNGWGDGIYLCKSGPLAGQFAVDTLSEPAIDEQAMTVRMRISTPQLDRVNHVVKQTGIKTDLYKNNPVVLYGHGMEGISLPVAQSEDEAGNLTVTTEADGTYAKAYHQARNKLSSQFFDLVVQKFLRSSSIGITPTEMKKGYDSDGDEVLFIDEGWLNEWSYCTIAINPGSRIVTKSFEILKEKHGLQCAAASRILLANQLDGTAIHPYIMKSLQASLVIQTTSPGFTPKEIKTMKTLTAPQVKAMKPKQLAKALMELKEFDEESQGMIKAAVEMMPEDSAAAEPAVGPVPDQVVKAEGDSVEEASESVEEEAETPDDDTPLGARVLRSIYENLSGLIDVSTKALAPVENPEVKDAATEIINQMSELATSLEGVFSGKYSDQPGLAPSGDEPTDEVVKGFLGSTRGRNQLQGLSARVDMIAKASKAGKLTAPHAKLLAQTASDLARLNATAKAYKPAKPAAATPAADAVDLAQVTKGFIDLQTQFKTLVETLSVTPMPMPKPKV